MSTPEEVIARTSPTNFGGAGTDTPYAAARLVVTLVLMMVGASGMYIVPVVLPSVQAEFGVARADAAMPYSLLMIGFGLGLLMAGYICDRIGGLRTLLLGSVLQAVALLLFLPFDSLASLYIIAALFGLFQGGIVPSYAIIIREHFPPSQAGARVGLVIMCTLFGMALGGWMSGMVFDMAGSYAAAFLNGIGWNAVNLLIAGMLLYRTRRTREVATAA